MHVCVLRCYGVCVYGVCDTIAPSKTFKQTQRQKRERKKKMNEENHSSSFPLRDESPFWCFGGGGSVSHTGYVVTS